MTCCVIFGGSGFVGTHLARRLLATDRFSSIHLADIRDSSLMGQARVTFSRTDVRDGIPVDITSQAPEWIFNLAAIHREPGHSPSEYFATNLAGASNVCDYAERVGCQNIYFTSSISVYGPTLKPTAETSPIRPITAYGASKYPAELINQCWFVKGRGRRLIICRPGVVYGPGDPGNILRMIQALKRGYFAIPGSGSIVKSYGYVYGLLDSIEFTMAAEDALIRYNYVEHPSEPLNTIVQEAKSFLSSGAPVFRIPLGVLLPIARITSAVLGGGSPIHPDRVKKAATPTHIVPGWLVDRGFQFNYPFSESLKHWGQIAPEDFR